MKKFESAYLEIIYFDVSDVVYTSGLTYEENGGNDDFDDFGKLF